MADPNITFPQTPDAPTGSINTPDISPAGKIRRPAIRDGAQAYSIATHLEQANSTRNTVNATIWNKYNGGQPYDPQAMSDSGQSNRYNFPTGFLSSIVDRITPTPIGIIDTARYLTSAMLDNAGGKNQDADRKSDIMKERITKTIRQWNNWKTFVTELCQEVVLSGAAFALRLDPYTPWPKFFRVDQAFVPDGTGQHANLVQTLSAKEDVLIHLLTEKIVDRQAAADAGWDVDATAKVINEALPKSQPNTGDQTAGQPRTYEDAIREGNLGASFAGATMAELWHVVAVEPTDEVGVEAKVTHFILNRRGNHETLFQKENRFKNMEDVVALFTLEPGNGKFYGSKGIGRKLINMHLAIERARNRMFDQLEMAGMLILKSDASSAPQVQFKVRHPFILVTSDATFEEQTVQANVQAFLEADAKVSDLAQQAVGAYLPNVLTGDQGTREKTAREVSVDYSRENEAKVAFLSRFWGQFADLVSMIQRNLLDPETMDKDAKALQNYLMEEGITREDMDEYAKMPAAEVVQDLTQAENQQMLAVSAKYTGNPNIDQRKLMQKDITALAGSRVADELILPDQELQVGDIEGIRQQMLETEAIMTGAPGIPVSPRDPHVTHLKVLLPDLQQGMQTASGGAHPEQLGKLAAGIAHAQGHTQVMEEQKMPPEVIKPFNDAIKQLDDQLKQVAIKSAQQMHQMETQQAAAQAPPPVQPARESIAINYKDAPEDIKRQMEVAAGFKPSQAPSPSQMSKIPYPSAPPSIKRQKEAAAGLQPSNPVEEQQSAAQEAVLKHPDLPEKIAQQAAAQQPNPAPVTPIPPNIPQNGGVPTPSTTDVTQQ